MKNINYPFPISLIVLAICTSCWNSQSSARFLFEEGVVSTKNVEYASTFSPSVDEVYFARSHDEWGKGGLVSAIFRSQKIEGRWTTPKLVNFSGTYDDSDPHLTDNGKTLYFISSRPGKDSIVTSDIWRVKRDLEGDWGIPEHLPHPINSFGVEYSPRTDGKGNLYFASTREGGFGQGDLYVSHLRNGAHSSPVNLGSTINSHYGEWNLEVNARGSILIFEASQREQNVSSYGDLYISFKKEGDWTIPQNLTELNTSGSDLYPFLTKDENYLYFSSSDSLSSTVTNIYYSNFSDLYQKYHSSAQVPNRYLLTVSRSGHSVELIDVNGNELVHSFPIGKGPHEISVSTDKKFAFVPNYGHYPKPHTQPIEPNELEWVQEAQNTVSKIDLTNFETTSFTIPHGHSYHGVLTNKDGSLFWITDELNGNLLEIDGISGEVIKRYNTMKGSHVVVGVSDFSKLFVSNIDSNTISVIEKDTDEVIHLKMPKGPEGMALTKDEKYLWVLCNSDKKVVVINTKNYEEKASFDSGGKFPVEITLVNEEAWIVNVFSRNISIFDAKTFEFKEHISLESTPLGITSNGSSVFVTLPRKNSIRAIDAKSRKVQKEYSFGMEQDGLTIINDVSGIISKSTLNR